jgi:hypothetical protein
MPNDLDVVAEIFHRCAEDHASDAPEAVDADFNHDVFELSWVDVPGSGRIKKPSRGSVNRERRALADGIEAVGRGSATHRSELLVLDKKFLVTRRSRDSRRWGWESAAWDWSCC